jgi:hypothetical protein
MKRTSLLLCLALPACGMIRHPLVTYVPPEEAAWFKLPHELPEEGRETLPGNMAAAIQPTMEDFLPPEAAPQPGPWSRRPACTGANPMT